MARLLGSSSSLLLGLLLALSLPAGASAQALRGNSSTGFEHRQLPPGQVGQGVE